MFVDAGACGELHGVVASALQWEYDFRMRFHLALLLLVTSFAAHAQVYRWVDKNGTVHYSDAAPPSGVKAATIDIDTKPGAPSPDTTECYSVRCQGERLEQRLARREVVQARDAELRAALTPPPWRGLEFRKYISIQRGMTEGELLGIAGPPDLRTDQGIAIAAPATVQVDRNLS